MTCIVGIAQAGRVVIGGDSAGVDCGWRLTVRADAKVWTTGEWAFGFTSSFRMGQILRYRLDPPPREDGQPLEAYLATAWVDHVRHILTDGGWLQTREGRADGGTFLVGHAGRLFVVEDDFQVGEAVDGFAAVGSGAQVALGALWATRAWRDRQKRVLIALEAAERHNAGVRGPFEVVEATTADRAR
jgi:ATP-dependent protease HslVU (ClpYQ) peptidase subunit